MAKRKNGQGSISLAYNKNGKIRYRMRQQYGFLPNGRPRILTVTGNSESACYKLMHEKIEDTKKISSYVYDNDIKKKTVSDLCRMHLEYDLSMKGKLKPKAADRRESTIKNQIQPHLIGRLQVTSVKPKDIENHIERLINIGYSVSTVSKTLDVINAAYKWSNDQGYIGDFNPCTPVIERLKNRLRNLEKRDLSSGVVVVLSESQIMQLETYVKMMPREPAYLYITGLSALLLLYTGIRVGELTALRWKDYTEETHTLTISKTRNVAKDRDTGGFVPNENEVKNYHSRTLVLSENAVDVINMIREITSNNAPDDYIIINKVNKPTNPSNYGSNINKLYRLAGLPDEISGAHVLRRTFATQLHSRGSQVEDIAAYLGDTPETITKHYISLTQRIVADGKVLNVVPLPDKKGQ